MDASDATPGKPELDQGVLDTLRLAEMEKLQLSCELHDGLLQQVVGMRMQVEALRRRLQTGSLVDSDSMIAELVLVERSLIAAIDHGRKWIGELRGNVDLKIASLVRILEQSVHEARSQWPGFQILADLDPAIDLANLSEPMKTAILRIAQESIRNACRHSGGKEVVLSASYDPDSNQWMMEIQDNGRGFDVGHLPEDHYGVLGMRTRAELIGAHFAVESKQGMGSKVLLQLSLPPSRRIGGAAV